MKEKEKSRKIAILFFLQFFCVVESTLMVMWIIRNWYFIQNRFLETNQWSGVTFAALMMSGIIITELKMQKISKLQQ